MAVRFLAFILIFITNDEFAFVRCDQFSIVSTTASPSDNNFEIHDALRALNATIDHLKRTKEELVATIDSVVEKKLKNYESQLSGMSRDCKEVERRGSVDSGIYRIRPELASGDFLVWCDMSAYGGGWTHVLNRFDGSQNFYLNWTDYKYGFGQISGEHWLGLEHLYELTNSKSNELLFELIDWDSKKVHALYEKFKVAAESEYYKIQAIGSYRGDAGDSFSPHLGKKFSTGDVDQDRDSGNCAIYREGAWWYDNCYDAHLTGRYLRDLKPDTDYKSAIKWGLFHGFNYSLKEVRMMIRPRTG